MESEGESVLKPVKNVGGQVCQICGDNVGKTAEGEPFVACDICAFPVCRPCYEYERKDGNQCPQCKTRYKRHIGSTAILGEKDEEGAIDVNYPSDNENQKQKIAERMLSWQRTYGRGDPNYDKEGSHNNIPLLANGTGVSGELSAASPGRFSMASPGTGTGKSDIRVVDPVRELGSPGFGNVAWKERVDGWKMKQDKNAIPMTNSRPPSERGGQDIDASTDILLDDSILQE